MSSQVTVQPARDLIPGEIVLPCEHTDAVVSVAIWVDEHTGKVWAPGLQDLRSVVAHGSISVVEDYCRMWTRWLARAETKTERAS